MITTPYINSANVDQNGDFGVIGVTYGEPDELITKDPIPFNQPGKDVIFEPMKKPTSTVDANGNRIETSYVYFDSRGQPTTNQNQAYWESAITRTIHPSRAVRGTQAILDVGISSINAAANRINDILTKYDPTNPAQMLQSQVALNNYNLALTVTSATLKSVEDTAKAISRNVS